MARSLTPAAVLAVAEPILHQPFEWGRCDCTSAVCDIFAALHGVDPLAPWRGSYDSQRSAWRVIGSMAGAHGAFAEMARRAGLVPGEAIGGLGLSGKSLAICVQPDMWVGKSQSGMAVIRSVDEAYHLA